MASQVNWLICFCCFSIIFFKTKITDTEEIFPKYVSKRNPGIDSWSIIYFGIGLFSVSVLILIYQIILKFKKNKKWKN